MLSKCGAGGVEFMEEGFAIMPWRRSKAPVAPVVAWYLSPIDISVLARSYENVRLKAKRPEK
jgi:hypothetical protein